MKYLCYMDEMPDPISLSVKSVLRTAACLIIPALLTTACGTSPPLRLGAEWHPSPNHDGRRPNFIILHQTSNDAAWKALATLSSPEKRVSAHYLVERDGRLHQLVDESRRGWHAGRSWWGGTTDLNSASIGIELDNTGDEPFPDEQIAALVSLLQELTRDYRIPHWNILGHGDVAPGRKVDPSRYFPWRRLAAAGFGLWCEPTYAIADPIPAADIGLQALGYDVSNIGAATSAFRRHFAGIDGDDPLTADERSLLACLVARKAAAPVGSN